MKPDALIRLPRPNLGPEPWPEAPLWPWLVAAIVVVALLTMTTVMLRRRRRKQQTKNPPQVQPSPPIAKPSTGADPVREALVRAFGPSWRARTTEEVAASPDLASRFGDEVTGQVIAYLLAVDRTKFSGDSSAPTEDLNWWAARFIEEVNATGTTPINTDININIAFFRS